MSTFIESCLCRGRGPSGVAPQRHMGRPDLIAAMLRERDVVRFVAASPGYGRSALAYEYADIVFGFRHVFWVKATSPCFLRDLDAGSLVDGVARLDREAALVVWEDVPLLSQDRAAAFAEVLDALLARRVESVVTCTPSADCYGQLQRDRLLLTARDLLLSDEEMKAEAEAGRAPKGWEAAASESFRIPSVRWCGHDAAPLLLRGLQTEELPGEMWLAMLAMLLMEQGNAEELLGFLPAERAEEAFRVIAIEYPLFGADERTGLFAALEVEVDVVLDAFAKRLDALAAASLHESRGQLCDHLADALMERGQADRACAFASAVSTKKAGGPWLARRGWRLLAAGQAQPYCEFHQRVAHAATGLGSRLSIQRAWAAHMMDDEPTALKHARRVMVSRTSDAVDQLAAQVLVTRSGSLEARDLAARELERTLNERPSRPSRENDPRIHDFGDWAVLGQVALALRSGPEAGLAVWLHALGEYRASAFDSGIPADGADRDPERQKSLRAALLLGAAWLIDEHANGSASADDSAPGAEGHLGFDEAAAFVRGCLEEEARVRHLGWHAVVAASALERVGSANPRMAAYLPKPSDSALLHRAEVAFFEQQEAYRRSIAARRAAAQRREAYQVEVPLDSAGEAAANPVRDERRPPALTVRMFGGFDVRVGDAEVRDPALQRSKTRQLLQLLVLNRGREMSKERLMELLWPESEPKRAKKNFYSTWSQLRGILAIDGVCPYLVRTRNGCRIERSLVHSDLADFDKLCRALLFESPEAENWERLYLLVSTEYGEDLLASESGSKVVTDMRGALRTQLVDGIVAAAARLAGRGEARGALWFAREAMRRDPHREDVYIVLMEAQILANQRGEALDTYFLCRRFLSESLGIDPSLRLVQLYRSVIESEEVVA